MQEHNYEPQEQATEQNEEVEEEKKIFLHDTLPRRTAAAGFDIVLGL